MNESATRPIEAPDVPDRPLPEYLAGTNGVTPVRPVWIPWPIAIPLAPLFWISRDASGRTSPPRAGVLPWLAT